MLIIVSSIELDELQPLLDAYDVAKAESDRDSIAEQVSAMVGSTVQGMLRQRLRGLNLRPDEINALSDEAIRSTLDGYGRTRLKRTDVIPERMVEYLHDPGNPWGQQLWSLLPADLHDELASAKYLKAPLAQRLVNEINRMLDNPLFLKDLGVEVQRPSESAIDRSYQHAEALHRLFPEAVAKIEQPEAKFMGFLSNYTLPSVLRLARQAGDGSASEEFAKAWRRIQPVVEELRNHSGGVEPTAQEVQQAYRQKLAGLFGSRLAWWEEQLRQVGRPFRVKDPSAYNDAKDTLAEHGYDPKQWETPDSPYYLSKEFLKPYSLKTVERALNAFGGHGAGGVSWAPSAPSSSSALEPQLPSWALEVGRQGKGSDLYRAIVEVVYPDPQSAERIVGEFLAEHPDPTPQDIAAFLDALVAQDPETAGLIRDSWSQIVRAVDRSVTQSLGDQQVLGLISERFGAGPASMASIWESVRRTIFARTTRFIRIASRHG